MIRLVVDTNVYISALMFGGLPGSLLDLVFLQSFVTVISADLLDELDEKLRLKFEVSPEDAETVIQRIAGVAELCFPKKPLTSSARTQTTTEYLNARCRERRTIL
jgi:putative PIN family toxin of toxin-antitoxin system